MSNNKEQISNQFQYSKSKLKKFRPRSDVKLWCSTTPASGLPAAGRRDTVRYKPCTNCERSEAISYFVQERLLHPA